MLGHGSVRLDNMCDNTYHDLMSETLRAEIKQSAQFKSLEQEVFLQVLRTAAILEHAVTEGLRPYGLTPAQYNVLRILRGAGEKGLCRNEVGCRMLTPVPDATRMLDRLVDRGLVVRERDAADKRFVTARITPEGLDLLSQLDEPIEEMHRKRLGHLSRAELRELADRLEAARRTE